MPSKVIGALNSQKIIDKKASDAISAQAQTLVKKSSSVNKNISSDIKKIVPDAPKELRHTSESIRQEALEQARGERLLNFVTGEKANKSAIESYFEFDKAGKFDTGKFPMEFDAKKIQAEKQAELKDRLLQKHADKLIEKEKMNF